MHNLGAAMHTLFNRPAVIVPAAARQQWEDQM
jgi:hypothetical protein